MEQELLDYLNDLKERLDRIEKLLIEKAIKFRGDMTDVRGAAKITGLSISRIYNLICEKKIPCFKKGKKLFFSKPELIEWSTPRKKNDRKKRGNKKNEEPPEQDSFPD